MKNILYNIPIPTRKTVERFIVNVILISAVFLTWIGVFWAIYPYPTAEVQQPITILNPNKEIAIGDNIVMELKIDKPTNIKPEGARFITCNDGNLVTLSSLATRLPTGRYTYVNDQYVLLPKVQAGSRCTFHFINQYRVNPIRVIEREWVSEQFLVLPKR